MTFPTTTPVQILGLLINSAYYRCPSCQDKHYIFGTLDSAHRAVGELGLEQEPSFIARAAGSGILGELPLVADVSRLGDQGRLGELFVGQRGTGSLGDEGDLQEVRSVMEHVAERLWESLSRTPTL